MTTQPAPAWTPISTRPKKWPVLLKRTNGTTTTADHEIDFIDLTTFSGCVQWCYIQLPPLPPEQTAEERQAESDKQAWHKWSQTPPPTQTIYSYPHTAFLAGAAHARAEGTEKVAAYQKVVADVVRLLGHGCCGLSTEEIAPYLASRLGRDAERVKELEEILAVLRKDVPGLADRNIALEQQLAAANAARDEEWRQELESLVAAFSRAVEALRIVSSNTEWQFAAEGSTQALHSRMAYAKKYADDTGWYLNNLRALAEKGLTNDA